ncbi:MAG: hypothetical protein HY545_00450, partial [Candidatus Doudnabacteria bacterium]|nr:hypothetical protein [Candidatus Doudnabacteria bacterium]
MINLEKISGLPLELGDDYHLKFKPPLVEIAPAIRTFEDMRPVYQNQDITAPMNEMYYMYRGLSLPEHAGIIRQNNVRYDITVIPACLIGREFNKTLGHYHPPNSKGMPYPEVCEVLYGKALFLIQKMDKDFANLIGVIAILANVGDKIIYPPGYGHIIVNIGVDTLVTANWSADNFESLYQPIKDRHGMACYVINEGTSQYSFAPNPNYQSQPPVRTISTNFMKRFAIA